MTSLIKSDINSAAMNEQHYEIMRLLTELKDLVLLAIPEARFPRGLKRPDVVRPSLSGSDLDNLSGEALEVRREQIALTALDYLVGLDVKQRIARRYPPIISTYVQSFLMLAHDMGVDPPLYPITYCSTLLNAMTMRNGFKQFPRRVAENTLARLEESGRIVTRALREVHHKSESETRVVMRAADLPLVELLRDGPPFTAADVRQALRDGTEWWLDGGDPWSGPQSAGAAGDGDGGWAIDPEPESAPPKKKPASGGWSVGGGVS